jgi:hypothetical protein
MEVQITSNLCLGRIYHLNYTIWFNIPHNLICPFLLSIHKLNCNLKYFMMVLDIMIYIKK